MSPSPDDDATAKPIRKKLSELFWRLTPACKEVARLTSRQLDHPLPLGTLLRLALHRAFCTWCARYARQLRFIHESAISLPAHLENTGPHSLPPESKVRLKRALRIVPPP
jgi:hypothetical protein